MMGASLIWLLSGRTGKDGHSFVNSDLFQEVYVSNHGRVRIVKVLQVSAESRAWAADPRNRLCDAPGSWYCPGQYPPLLLELFDKGAKKGNLEATAYQRDYEARLLAQESEKPQPNGADIPKGSYLDSCAGCRLEEGGPRLRCTHCRVPGSPSGPSELNVATCSAPVTVDNIQGALQCKPPPNAPNIPRGGYARSCQGCKLEEGGALLSCSHCDTADGGRKASSFPLARCKAPGVLDNSNGNIVCHGMPNGRNIPSGGYQQTCNGCELEGENGAFLRCFDCRTAAGGQRESTIQVSSCTPPASIDNVGGILTCVGLKNDANIPPGGYQDSCQGCRVDARRPAPVLLCTHCRAADGRQHASSHELYRCPPPGELENRDGRLACRGVPNALSLPSGPYLETCQGCKLEGAGASQLSCSHCRTADGRQIEASLVLASCPEGATIGNDDGRLACRAA